MSADVVGDILVIITAVAGFIVFLYGVAATRGTRLLERQAMTMGEDPKDERSTEDRGRAYADRMFAPLLLSTEDEEKVRKLLKARKEGK